MPRCEATRLLLTCLHACGGAAASVGFLATELLRWDHNLSCLPPFFNTFGDPVSVNGTLGHVCDIVTYSSGAVAVLCFIMAISLNYCWDSWCSAFMHQVMTTLLCLVCTASGAALTIDFVLWCKSLQDTFMHSDGCFSAANSYDKKHVPSNMTHYFKMMAVQEACTWAAVPFLMSAILVYSIAMKANLQRQQTEHDLSRSVTTGRYYLHDSESAPLLREETSLMSRDVGGSVNRHAAGTVSQALVSRAKGSGTLSSDPTTSTEN